MTEGCLKNRGVKVKQGSTVGPCRLQCGIYILMCGCVSNLSKMLLFVVLYIFKTIMISWGLTPQPAADQEPLSQNGRRASGCTHKAATGAWCAKVAEGVCVWGDKGMRVRHSCVYTGVHSHVRPALHTVGLPPSKRKSEALHCKLRKARVHG